MTYDQAQSPRLGQRTPIESTYVQIFDVDPATVTEDLIEAAWPGMLVFRKDRSILQIYNGERSAWEDVAGGVAGQLTFVDDDMPATGPFSVGDVWYDSDDGYKAYVWSGSGWVPSVGGITTYYETGFVPDPIPADPTAVPPIEADPDHLRWAPLSGTFFVGDLWYQTDDANHLYRWNGTAWLDAQDGGVVFNNEQVGINSGEIANLSDTVNELSFLASSANNTADTADGRVSMSDYMPGPDDVVYDQLVTNLETGETTISQVERQNGSIWFTRTRPRRNLCTNPSFETNLNDWTPSGCTAARVSALNVPSGDWTCEVTNSGTAVPHRMTWGVGLLAECEADQVFTASTYGELISGSGAGVYLEILWYDASQAPLGSTVSDPFQLVINAWDPLSAGTMAEPRFWVTGVAPSGAAFLNIQVVSPAVNTGDVWHMGAVLLEQEDDLGRYFDGDSYPYLSGEAYWDGVPHGSVSELLGDKITEIWELRDGSWIRKYLTSLVLDTVSTAKLTGEIAGSSISQNSLTPDKMASGIVTASEALVAGDLVNVWNSGGTFRVRRACAATGTQYEAHGFVLAAVASGALATIYHAGYDQSFTGLAPGAQWLSTTPGKVTNQPPSLLGQLVQRVGYASYDTVLEFQPGPAIRIT